MSASVLIVEDDKTLAELLHFNFEKEEFGVSTRHDGRDALLACEEELPDLILLDWMLPSLSGPEICHHLRANPKTRKIPVIMLTARDSEEDVVRSFRAGADDYVTKPFSMPYLLAKVAALLRRSAIDDVLDVLTVGDIRLDPTSHQVTRKGNRVKLGPTEYRILMYLMRRPGRVFLRAQIVHEVWGPNACVDERNINAHMACLRKSLSQKNLPDPIITVRGVGYKIEQRRTLNAKVALP